MAAFEGDVPDPQQPRSADAGLHRQRRQQLQQRDLNETQHERTDFAIISLQKHVNDIDMQISAYTRYSSLSFSPDWLGDLLFNGIAQQANRSDAAYGVQADGSWRINDQHTLRAGFLVQQEIATGKHILAGAAGGQHRHADD